MQPGRQERHTAGCGGKTTVTLHAAGRASINTEQLGAHRRPASDEASGSIGWSTIRFVCAQINVTSSFSRLHQIWKFKLVMKGRFQHPTHRPAKGQTETERNGQYMF